MLSRSESQRRSAKLDDTSDADDMSISTEIDHNRDEGPMLEGFIEALYDQSAKAREEGLKGLITAFKNHVLVQLISDKYETLLHLCISSFKKGTSIEIVCASQLLGLLAITAGFGQISEQIVSNSSSHLIKIAKFGSDVKVRISAIQSLAMINFVGSPELVLKEPMKNLLQFYGQKRNNLTDQKFGTSKPSAEVRAAALSAWSFLLTKLTSTQCLVDYMAESLSTLISLLDGKNGALRLAAGEALAILYEKRSELMVGRNQLCRYTTRKDMVAVTDKLLEEEKDQIIDKVRALINEPVRKGQTSNKSQRKYFKEILATLTGGVGPNETLKMRFKDILTIDGWGRKIQLRSFTEMLKGGMQRHLQENPYVYQVFDYTPRTERLPPLLRKEKRINLSPMSIFSKKRTRQRNYLRSACQEKKIGRFSVTQDAFEED